ncbi:hypothetical protein Tco_1288001 [Tanacetum coccineum]
MRALVNQNIYIATHLEDSRGNKQPLDRKTTSMTLNEGTAKTMPHLEGSLGDKDSGGNIPPADMELIHTPVVDPLGTSAKYQIKKAIKRIAAGDDMDEDPQDDKEVRTPSPKQDQPEPSHVQESASDSSSLDLKKFDNILPLTERQLIKMSGVELSQTALKREISSLRKDTFEIKSMMTEMYAAFRENANTTATEEPPSYTEEETEEPKLAIPISSIPSTEILPTQAQLITSIIIHLESSQATPKIDKEKGIATESDDDPSKKLVKASSIVRPDLDKPDRVEFKTNGKTVC